MIDNTNTISVSPVQVDDYAKWLPYWLDYQKFYNVQLSEQATLVTWKRFFAAEIPMYVQ